MYRTDFWTLWEKARVGCFKRTASKLVYYLGWNRSPAQVGCMRQVLGPGALRRPRGIGWRGRWEGGAGCGIQVNPWLIHVNVWQKPLQYCKVISLQLIKIIIIKKLKKRRHSILRSQSVVLDIIFMNVHAYIHVDIYVWMEPILHSDDHNHIPSLGKNIVIYQAML